MIAAWMLYVAAVSALLSIAAFVGERAARDTGRPVRLVWMLAMSLMLVTGVISALRGASTDDTAVAAPVTSMNDERSAFAPVSGAFSPLSAVAIPSAVSVSPNMSTLDRPLLLLWGAGSLLWGALLLVSAARIRRVKAVSRLEVVDNTRVYVTEGIGPALFGLFRPHIVLPSWVLSLPDVDRQMILTHEGEHARARDPLTLACAALCVLLVPWNPFVWLMFARLRFAIEADCDARVLARTGNVRGYGALLLTVGERSHGKITPVLALVESSSHLERRILLMTRRRPANRLLRTVVAVVAGVVLLAATRGIPRPQSATDTVSMIGPAQVSFIQYRWIDETSSTNRDLVMYTDPNSDARIALSDTVMLDVAGIDSAWVSYQPEHPDEFSVAVILNASGAASMRASTTAHVGRRLAVVIDDRVVTVAKVESPLGRVIPVGMFARVEADSLAERITREARGR